MAIKRAAAILFAEMSPMTKPSRSLPSFRIIVIIAADFES